MAVVVPLVQGLDEAAYAVLMACLQAAMAHRAAADPRPLDEDLQQAAAALAATAETASRGVLYEHQPASHGAARLARAMSEPLAEAAKGGMPKLERATAAALRRVEEVVKGFRRGSPESSEAFFALLERVLEPRMTDAATGQPLDKGPESLLVLP